MYVRLLGAKSLAGPGSLLLSEVLLHAADATVYIRNLHNRCSTAPDI